MRGPESSEPVFLPAFRLSAQPLRHLEYLLEPVTQAVVLGNDPVLVNLPDPARFALHKLWTSTRRIPAFQTKAKKDIIQAEQLIEVLLEDRPNDLRDAWSALPRGKIRGTVSKVLSKLRAENQDRIRTIIGEPQ